MRRGAASPSGGSGVRRRCARETRERRDGGMDVPVLRRAKCQRASSDLGRRELSLSFCAICRIICGHVGVFSTIVSTWFLLFY